MLKEVKSVDVSPIPGTLEEMLDILGRLSLADISRVRGAFSEKDPDTGELFDSTAVLGPIIDVAHDEEMRVAYRVIRGAMEHRAWMETPPGYGAWTHLADLGVATLAVRRLGSEAPPALVARVAAAWAAATDRSIA
jgi:hypothetical protein